MCGICGIWNYKTNAPVDRDLLWRMTNAMTHRGPDDSGLYIDNNNGVGLGFRRLAIIDLSPAGHQPMCNEDESLWIVFNGEIYNFLDLRPPLESKGHIFRSRTDTEVILHLYEEHGADMVNELWGMFGMAVWDQHQRRLILARDRVGKKPLYYYDDGQRLIFASELKSILEDHSIARQIDLDALVEYIALGYVGSPRTILSGICKLPPAHVLIYQDNGHRLHRYWNWLPAFQPDYSISEAEWAERLRTTLGESVRSRMISDVPLGAFLSGGVDSSSVVATMASLSDRPIKTFSIGFHEREFSELTYARQVAQKFRTEHHEFIVEPESIADVLPKLARQFDEPFGDPSALPTYYVSKMARQVVTVVLSGDGGDEALAGYDRYDRVIREGWIDHFPFLRSQTLLTIPLKIIPPYVKGNRLLHRLAVAPEERYLFALQIFYAEQSRYLFSPEVANHVTRLPGFLEESWREAARLDSLSRMQCTDGLTYLPEDILVKVDRMSMLTSLETRCPLLDHRFLELAASIPPQLRLKNGEGKYIYKKALEGLLPPTILRRPKMGFGIPGQKWLRGDSTNFVRDVMSDQRVVERGLFRKEVLRTIIKDALSPASNFWPQVWSLLMLELWCRSYLDAK